MDDIEEIPDLIDIPFESRKTIPVTILSGFLGSGKSTLINHILTAQHGKRIAVIENEFSEGLSIETMIAKNGTDGSNIIDFFELNNGCICCSMKSDLLTTLEQLAIHKSKFDYVVIETTGVANPGPIISSLWVDEGAESSLYLDGVVTVVDALNLELYLKSPETFHDVRLQISYADRILINKTDLVSPNQLIRVESQVRQINGLAEIFQTTYSKLSPSLVLDIKSFSMKDQSNLLPSLQWDTLFCQPCVPDNFITDATDTRTAIPPSLPLPPTHTAISLSTVAIQLEGHFSIQLLKLFLDSVLCKAVENVSDHQSHLIERSQHLSIEEFKMKIFRMKGVIKIKNESQLYILQAVHDIFDIQPSSYGVLESFNKVVVIGKCLDIGALEAGLKKCLSPI